MDKVLEDLKTQHIKIKERYVERILALQKKCKHKNQASACGNLPNSRQLVMVTVCRDCGKEYTVNVPTITPGTVSVAAINQILESFRLE